MTPAELLLLPGEALPGLLDGWRGPLLHGDNDVTLIGLDCDGGHGPLLVSSTEPWPDLPLETSWMAQSVRHGEVALPLRRWEARAHLARHLCAGVKCLTTVCLEGITRDELGARLPTCRLCKGTRWRVPPHNVRWMLDWPGTELAAHESAALLAATALRVAAGGDPVGKLLRAWEADADADALELGFALRGGPGVLVPTPDGPVTVAPGDM